MAGIDISALKGNSGLTVAGGSKAAPGPEPGKATEEDSARTIRDTVSLSAGGQKIVNLARGQELAAEIRNAPLDENFEGTLARALEDVFRITRLLFETLKAGFDSFRSAFRSAFRF